MREAWRSTKPLSEAEAAFLAQFAAQNDRGTFIEDTFLRAAIEGGETIKTYTCRGPDANEDEDKDGEEDNDTGWVGLHRFFGMYVINCTQYGEGQDDYGPFAKKKDAEAVFDAAIAWKT